MASYIYVMKGLNKSYSGGKQILKDTWLSFLPGAKIGIIGNNGAGKSTILKIMAGIDKEFQGEAWAAQGTTIGYLPQEPELNPNLNVQENILSGLKEQKALLDEFDAISAKFSEELSENEMNNLINRQAELQEKIEAADAWELNRTIEIAMDALRCPPATANVSLLSGGEKRRVALCKLLLQKPDLLLLDEPTNHLDAESVAWLEQHLKSYKGTIVLITHDRYFLDNVVNWILELDRGNAYPFEGNYTSWLDQKSKRLEIEGKQEQARQRTLANELNWIRKTPAAKQAKARIKSYESLLLKEIDKPLEQSQIFIPAGPRLGDLVIEANNLSKSYDDYFLFENLSFKLPPGGIVGIIGPNGAGKTTLFRLLCSTENSDSGTIKIGETVKMAYVDQSRDSLNSNKTIWEEISDGLNEIDLGKKKVSSRAYVAGFGFKGSDQQKIVGQLSGGERNRVHIAKLIKSGANVILLDEPTNDLDIETLRSLEEALLGFAGCAVIISHDRWFLDRIATHILAFEGESNVFWFEGNYTDYETDRKKRFGIDAIEPKRIRYKALIRS